MTNPEDMDALLKALAGPQAAQQRSELAQMELAKLLSKPAYRPPNYSNPMAQATSGITQSARQFGDLFQGHVLRKRVEDEQAAANDTSGVSALAKLYAGMLGGEDAPVEPSALVSAMRGEGVRPQELGPEPAPQPRMDPRALGMAMQSHPALAGQGKALLEHFNAAPGRELDLKGKRLGIQKTESEMADANAPAGPEMHQLAQRIGVQLPVGVTNRQARAFFDDAIRVNGQELHAQALRDGRVATRTAQEDRQEERRQELARKQGEKDKEKQAKMYEVEERFRSIIDRGAALKKMIQDKGTYETIGPHNAQMEQKLNEMATDAAKLFDKDSAAREGEVDLQRKGLPQVSAFGQSNNSAVAVLDSFLESMNKRRAAAFEVRGLPVPGAAGGPVQPASGANDARALEWAKANPNDPRAAKILELAGGAK